VRLRRPSEVVISAQIRRGKSSKKNLVPRNDRNFFWCSDVHSAGGSGGCTRNTVLARPTRHKNLCNQFSLAGEMTDDCRVGRVGTVGTEHQEEILCAPVAWRPRVGLLVVVRLGLTRPRYTPCPYTTRRAGSPPLRGSQSMFV